MHIIARMNVGGPAVEIADLMRGLDSSRISQCLVTGYCTDLEKDFLESQAPDIPVTRIRGFGKRVRPLDDLRTFAALIRIMRTWQPQVVHTHTAKAGVLGRLAARCSRVRPKVVHTHHGHLLHGYFGPMKTWLTIRVERLLSKITDCIVVVGVQVRDDLLGAGIGFPDQYVVIRSGVTLKALPEPQVARMELGIPDDQLVVTMIGRLTQIKRPDRFADVVEITEQLGLDICYLVAGGGELEMSLKEKIEGQKLSVLMLGWRSDLERILAATDIVILTSDNEGVPLSLVQAALVGVPAVATRVGSVPEVVVHGMTGFLCETNEADLAHRLIQLAASRQLRDDFGARARLWASRRFSPRKMFDAHMEIYEALTSK